MKPRCYLDHNATSPLRPEARSAMVAAFDCIGNPSSTHAEGRAARQIVESARETVAAMFEVDPSGVYFTGSGTEAANWLLQPRGDEMLAASAVEHPCVLSGHRFSQDKCQIIPVFEDGALDSGCPQGRAGSRFSCRHPSSEQRDRCRPADCGNRGNRAFQGRSADRRRGAGRRAPAASRA